MTHSEFSSECFLKLHELVKCLEAAGLQKDKAKVLELELAQKVIDTLRGIK